MLKHTLERENTRCSLVLAGNLTMENVHAGKLLLQDAIGSSEAIDVSIDQDATVDISFLQILCTAHRVASQQGKVFCLLRPLPEQVLALMKRLGFTRNMGCRYDKLRNCIWMTEGGSHV